MFIKKAVNFLDLCVLKIQKLCKIYKNKYKFYKTIKNNCNLNAQGLNENYKELKIKQIK